MNWTVIFAAEQHKYYLLTVSQEGGIVLPGAPKNGEVLLTLPRQRNLRCIKYNAIKLHIPPPWNGVMVKSGIQPEFSAVSLIRVTILRCGIQRELPLGILLSHDGHSEKKSS